MTAPPIEQPQDHAQAKSELVPTRVHAMPEQLHIGNRQAFKHRVLDEIDQGARAFVFDFAECGYVDSSGLGVLMSLSRSITAAGGRLVLCGLNDDLVTLLELTGIDKYFERADTRGRAIQVLAR